MELNWLITRLRHFSHQKKFCVAWILKLNFLKKSSTTIHFLPFRSHISQFTSSPFHGQHSGAIYVESHVQFAVYFRNLTIKISLNKMQYRVIAQFYLKVASVLLVVIICNVQVVNLLHMVDIKVYIPVIKVLFHVL